jgi:hypothetical protein
MISLVTVSLWPATSCTRMVTLHVPGAGAVVVAVPAAELTSNL